ncbi:homeobox protein Hox-C9-like [Malurus melanocephalus]|uniref:homeobox protein Hox-C9-like n=1 Tax=Malurus melanocephalus TaxID=175006 RepID=UPI002547E761|nr:homeobox protein Hox-C9-like [Malurus melanocephalus]
MSASGPISNYYVDSLIAHDSEELLAPRFAGAGPARPAGLVPECGDFPACSFAPKAPVFGSSWAPVASQPPVPYAHPGGHYAPQAAEPRYVRSWLEPLAGAVSFPAFGARPYGLKADAFAPRRAECGPADARAYADFVYAAPGELRDRAAQTIPSSPESEAIAAGKHKEEKHELDPSKSKSFLFTTAEGISASRSPLNKMKLPQRGEERDRERARP